MIYDSRDNETAPNIGSWSSALVEIYSKLVGSERDFNRITITDRRYFTIFEKLVFANRVLYEKILGDVPFSMYYPFGGSVRTDEGLGGSRTICGILKNRYLGDEKLFVNMELRYRFYNFTFLKQDFYIALNTFYDFGRVWHDDDIEGGLKNFKIGKGFGLHIGYLF